MDSLDYEYLSSLVKRESGLILTKDKSYLLESRLMPIVRLHELSTLSELVTLARSKTDQTIIKEITEAMTTNESFFFRDNRPFEIFQNNVLPGMIESRKGKKLIRIWCAAASSGQEPYSLAMILKDEAANLTGFKTDIIGTDISTEILAKAERGLYSQFEVQRGLPVTKLVQHFTKDGDNWQISDELRSMVQYKEINLLDSLKSLGIFDIVFCRNVLIYFDQETKSKVLDEICALMPADGLLLLRGAETVLGISEKFRPIPDFRGVYEVVQGDGSESDGRKHLPGLHAQKGKGCSRSVQQVWPPTCIESDRSGHRGR